MNYIVKEYKPQYNWRGSNAAKKEKARSKDLSQIDASTQRVSKGLAKSTSKQGRELRHKLTCAFSCSSSSISLGNRFLCMRSKDREDVNLWEIGKAMGLKCVRDEELLIQGLIKMERRDCVEARKGNEKGCHGTL